MDTLGGRIAALRARRGLSQAELGRLSGYKQQSIDSIEKDEVRRPARLREIARALGVSEGHLLGEEGEDAPPPPRPTARGRLVSVVGYVGAGAEVFVLDDHAHGGGLEEVEAPGEMGPDAVAVRVRGDSMLPAYEEGDLLFYSRHLPPAEMLHKRAVVKLQDGRLFVKIIHRGEKRGRFNLLSLNAASAGLYDVVLQWAAPIDWVKPRY
jgi:DNA-binding XRE family transcriptional regulator